MPKVLPSARRNRALHQQRHHHHDHTHHQQVEDTQLVSSPQHSHNVLLTAPRKVSFEHQSSSSFGSATSLTAAGSSSSGVSQDPSSALSTSSRSYSRSSLSSLRRKAPSSCLAGLVEESETSSSTSCCEPDATPASRRQDCLTPRPSAMQTDEEDATTKPASATVSAPSSPWGHFVDLLVPLDEVATLSTTAGANRRGWGDIGAPLFDSLGSSSGPPPQDDDDEDTAPTFAPRRSKGRRHHHHHHHHSGHALSHPYGLQPRHVRRRQLLSSSSNHRPRSCSEGDAATTSSSSSFLPGFFLDSPATVAPAKAPVFHRVPSVEADSTRQEAVSLASSTSVRGEDTRSVETALQRLTF